MGWVIIVREALDLELECVLAADGDAEAHVESLIQFYFPQVKNFEYTDESRCFDSLGSRFEFEVTSVVRA